MATMYSLCFNEVEHVCSHGESKLKLNKKKEIVMAVVAGDDDKPIKKFAKIRLEKRSKKFLKYVSFLLG